MSQELFRQEVLNAHKEKHFGEVIEARPVALSFLTMFGILIALAIISFATWGTYTRKASVDGFLAPDKGLVKVYAPQLGTVIEQYVTEGDSVKRGDRLFVLSSEQSSPETPEIQATVIQSLKQRRRSLDEVHDKQLLIDRMEDDVIRSQLSSMSAELVLLEKEIVTQESRLFGVEKKLLQQRTLLQSSLVAESEVADINQELLGEQLTLHDLQITRIRLNREKESLESELSRLVLERANSRESIKRQGLELEQEQIEYESRRNVVINAPTNGIVSALLINIGQYTSTTQPLLSLLPDGAQLEGRLLVPSRALGFIEPGQLVTLHYQTFPYQRFGSYQGRVKNIARTSISPNEVALPVTFEESVYVVTVTLNSQTVKAYGKDIPLFSGMLLEANVLLDKQRIIQWVFDPLLSIQGRV